MKQQHLLQTERLLLKSVTPEIFDAWVAQYSENEMAAIMGDAHAYEHFKNIHREGMSMFRITLLFFLLYKEDDPIPIGQCGYHTWNTYHRKAEIFYNLFREEDKNKGYMKEAVKAVLAYGFEEMNLNRIAVFVSKENIPSVKLIHHFGFQFEGTMRQDYFINGAMEDSEAYSLLHTEWKVNNTVL